jgi:heptaprenyl diphosphate synthase
MFFLGIIMSNENNKIISILAACCIFLSMIEYIIPKPIPFMRYGIANIPVIISLKILKPKQTIFLVFLKILGQGIATGMLFSYIFIFSLCGSATAGVIMILVYSLFTKEKITMIGVSVTGAFANNVVQLVIAKFIIFGDAAIAMAPAILCIGTITSFITGFFAESFIEKSQWIKKYVKN